MEAENKIINAYLELKKDILYFNQIKEFTKLSNSSLQNTLSKLINKNVLKLIKTKGNTFFKIKNRKYFSLKFSELVLTKFNNLNTGVKVPLINFIKKLPFDVFTVVLFGSSSRKEEQEDSDIDILIVKDCFSNFDKLKKEIEVSSNYSLNIFQCSIKQFYENTDPLIIQARKTGFSIYREQNFYEVILNEIK